MKNKKQRLMKRIAIIVVMVLCSLAASARSIHYFTFSQATRTVDYLNSQNELMIYCGYDYEIETYVLINEIWMERVNSSYYEIWIYGFDAYTGDEIYMPLDLQCVWLYSAGRMYNAAQYLRFRVDVRLPSFSWRIPPYNRYTRLAHRHGYVRTYHYDIHRYGWMPPAYNHTPGVHPPLPYYYMRRPNTPVPMPTNSWTPGTDRPTIPAPSVGRDNNTPADTRARNNSSTRNMTTEPTGNTPSTPATNSSSRNNNASQTTSTRNNTSTATTPSRNNTPSTTTPSRNNTSVTTTTPTRNNSATTTTPTRNSNRSNTSATSTTTSSRNGNASPTTTTTRSRNNNKENSSNNGGERTRNNSSTRTR